MNNGKVWLLLVKTDTKLSLRGVYLSKDDANMARYLDQKLLGLSLEVVETDLIESATQYFPEEILLWSVDDSK